MLNDNQDLPLALQHPNLPYLIRPVTLSDTVSLQSTIWNDRTLDSITDFINRVIKFHTQNRGIGVVVVDDNLLHKPIVAYGQVAQWVKCAEISDLWVVPNYRGQGIGTAMIQYLTAFISTRSDCVELGVAENNPRALALYQRLGFTASYTLQLDLGQGVEPVLYLQLNLVPHTKS